MEGFSANMYKRLKHYRRRKLGYQILLINSCGRHRRKQRIARATFGSHGKRKFWRIRIAPKLRIFNLGSPRKLLSRLREAYVKLMIGISKYSCRFRFSNCAGFPGSGSAVVNSVNESGTVSARSCDYDDRNRYSVMMKKKKKKKKEYCYEERLMAQIHSSLMAQGSMVPWCPSMIA